VETTLLSKIWFTWFPCGRGRTIFILGSLPLYRLIIYIDRRILWCTHFLFNMCPTKWAWLSSLSVLLLMEDNLMVFVYFQVEHTGRYIIFKFWELQNTFFYSLNMKKYKIGKYCTVFILKSSSIVYSIHCGTIFLLQFIGQMIYGSIRLSSL
jgi:hypothetical protein